MRILYGGTFDPVHFGHLAIAGAVADAFDAPVSLVPAGDPTHRPAPGATATQRAAMLDLAILGDVRMDVDRRELRRGGATFTVDTLEELRFELGAGMPLVWVMGLDSVIQLESWHNWERILQLASVLGVQRPGTEVDLDWLQRRAPRVHAELAPRAGTPASLARVACGKYSALAIRPLRAESATLVRQRIASGERWDAAVPPAVAHYIREHDLDRPHAGL